MSSSEDPRKNIAYEIRGTFRAFENALITYLAKTDVTVACFHVLRLPWTEEGLSQSTISNLAFMTPSVTSQLIQKLSKEELLTRERLDKDSRKIQVFLTKQGWQLRATVLDGALRISQSACKNLSNEDIDTLVTALASIRSVLEQDEVDQ